jgi:tetratricopeptide (TPR) repeat protein
MQLFLAKIQVAESQGEFKKAWDISEEIHGLLRQADDKNSPTAHRLAIQRARLQIMMGDYEAAMREYESWESNRSGQSHEPIWTLHTATQWINLLDLIGPANQEPSARLRAESINDAFLGTPLTFHHDDWALIVEHFSRIGKTPDGLAKLERWHEEWMRNRSPKHVCMGGLKAAIADCYHVDGEFDRAEQIANEGLELLRDTLGPQAGKTIDCQLVLARVHVGQNNMSEAERLASRAVEATENACGMDHPRTWYVRRQFARILFDIGRQNDAIKIARETLDSIRSRLGIHHPDYAESVLLALELQNAEDDKSVVLEFFSPMVEEFKKATPVNNLPRRQMEQWMEKLLSHSSSR